MTEEESDAILQLAKEDWTAALVVHEQLEIALEKLREIRQIPQMLKEFSELSSAIEKDLGLALKGTPTLRVIQSMVKYWRERLAHSKDPVNPGGKRSEIEGTDDGRR